jgi:uncharacterized protein YgfB (UPF0149 family)
MDRVMSELSLPNYASVISELNTAGIAVTPAEMHGLLVGMLSGGLSFKGDEWQPLIFDYTNDGIGWPMTCLALAEQSLKVTRNEFSEDTFELSMLLPDDSDLEIYAHAVGQWVSHFVSGLGLIDAQLGKGSDESKEALQDLLEIARLEIDPDGDLKEQAMLLEQVLEHIKVCVLTIHTDLGAKSTQPNPKKVH